jgi:hypothetical protein
MLAPFGAFQFSSSFSIRSPQRCLITIRIMPRSSLNGSQSLGISNERLVVDPVSRGQGVSGRREQDDACGVLGSGAGGGEEEREEERGEGLVP